MTPTVALNDAVSPSAHLPNARAWSVLEASALRQHDLKAQLQVSSGQQDSTEGQISFFRSSGIASSNEGGLRSGTQIAITDRDKAMGTALVPSASTPLGELDLTTSVGSFPPPFARSVRILPTATPMRVQYTRAVVYIDNRQRQIELRISGSLAFTRSQWNRFQLSGVPSLSQLLDAEASTGSYTVKILTKDRLGQSEFSFEGDSPSLRRQFELVASALTAPLASANPGVSTHSLAEFLAPQATVGAQYASIRAYFDEAIRVSEAAKRIELDAELDADVRRTQNLLLEERIDGDDERSLMNLARKWAAHKDVMTKDGRSYFDEYLSRLRESRWSRDYLFFSGSSTSFYDSLFEEVEEKRGQLSSLVSQSSIDYGDYVPLWDPTKNQTRAPDAELTKRIAGQILDGLEGYTSDDDEKIILESLTGLRGPTQGAVLKEVMSHYDDRNWIGLGKYGEAWGGGMLYWLFEDLDEGDRDKLGASLVAEGVVPQGSVDALKGGRGWGGKYLPWTTYKASQQAQKWADVAVEEDSTTAKVIGTLYCLWLPETAGITVATLTGARVLPGVAKLHPYIEGGLLVGGTGLASYGVGIHTQAVITGKDPYSGRKLSDEDLIAHKLLLMSSSLFLAAGFMTAPSTQVRIFQHQAPNFGVLPQGWQAAGLSVRPFSQPSQATGRFGGVGRQLIRDGATGEVVEISGAAGAQEFTVTHLGSGRQLFLSRGGQIRIPGLPLSSGGTTIPGGGGASGTAATGGTAGPTSTSMVPTAPGAIAPTAHSVKPIVIPSSPLLLPASGLSLLSLPPVSGGLLLPARLQPSISTPSGLIAGDTLDAIEAAGLRGLDAMDSLYASGVRSFADLRSAGIRNTADADRLGLAFVLGDKALMGSRFPDFTLPVDKLVSGDLGVSLGSGGNKDVFAYGVDEAVGVLKPGKPETLIDEELAYLRELDRVGLPTINARKILVDGRPALIMERFEQGSKLVVKLDRGKVRIVGAKGFLNARSVTDLEKIRQTMLQHPVKIDDLQFLIARDGRVVIADPLKVVVGERPSKNNLRMIDLLIRAATDSQ